MYPIDIIEREREDFRLFGYNIIKRTFLTERGYKIISHLTAEEMEKKYLTLRDGSSAGKVPAFHRLVHASVSG